MLIPSGMEENACQGRAFAFPLPTALQLQRTASRCTNGSREDPGLSKGEGRMYRDEAQRFLRQKNPAPGKRLAQGGLSKDYLHASDVRSWVRRSLVRVD